MSNGISKLYSLEEIFDNRIFRIPDYQRGYSWKDEHVKALWDDIIHLEDGKIHYTGMITVQKPSYKDLHRWMREFKNVEINREKLIFQNHPQNIFSPYYIADGQQRLTTLILLLVSIRDKKKFDESLIQKKFITIMEDDGNTHFFGYETDMPSYHFLINQIYNNQNTSLVFENTAFTENLRKAKKFFDTEIDQFDREKLLYLYMKVIRQLKFNFYEIPESLDIFTVFETINYRGKPLSTLDLLKNRLIYLVSHFPTNDELLKDQLRKKINDQWSRIYKDLALDTDNILNDDDYLRIHWLVYFDHRGQSNQDLKRYRQNLLDEVFVKWNIVNEENSSPKLTLRKIEDYVESLGKCAKFFFNIRRPSDFQNELHPDIRYWLDKINRLMPKSYFEPLMLAALVENNTTELIIELLKNIERYLFLVFGLAGMRSITNRGPFLIEASQHYIHKKPLEIIIDKLKPELEHQNSRTKYDEPRVKIGTIEELMDLFRVNMKKNASNEGFLNWKYCRYFLYEYEEYLFTSNVGEFNTFHGSNKLELILPPPMDLPRNNKERRKKIKVYLDNRLLNWRKCVDSYSRDGGQQYLSFTLGNIIFPRTKRDINDFEDPKTFNLEEQKAYDFNFKKQYWYSSGLLNEQELCVVEEWTPFEILKRGLKLLSFMELRWNIEIDYSLKKEILYLNRLSIDDSGLNRIGMDGNQSTAYHSNGDPRHSASQVDVLEDGTTVWVKNDHFEEREEES